MLPLLKTRPRVLVLDDDASVRKLVALLLKRAGYRVDTVSKGNDAIAKIGAYADYAAVLLDLMMPHEGGMTVIRHLRKEKPAMLKRVILLTGAPDTVAKSVGKDVFAIVKKPFDAGELTDTVDKLAQ